MTVKELFSLFSSGLNNIYISTQEDGIVAESMNVGFVTKTLGGFEVLSWDVSVDKEGYAYIIVEVNLNKR